MNLGYACINSGLNSGPPKSRVFTNRGMVRRTFHAKGIEYAGELAQRNVEDLLTILRWNEAHSIRFFRLSSNLFPWASEYRLEELPQWSRILTLLEGCGSFAREHGHRITTHPGPFNVLASAREDVISNTVAELDRHAEIFDYMGLPETPYAKINIHVGGAYGDKGAALHRFCSNFERLGETTRARLTVENDDKASLYSTKELVEGVHSRIGIPVVHDIHHHNFCTGGLTGEEALKLAATTWGDCTPVVHYSQSRSEEAGCSRIKPQAHSNSFWIPVETFGVKVDIMLECKYKEVALFKMRDLLGERV